MGQGQVGLGVGTGCIPRLPCPHAPFQEKALSTEDHTGVSPWGVAAAGGLDIGVEIQEVASGS